MKHNMKTMLTVLLAALLLFAAVTPALAADDLPKGALLLQDSDFMKVNEVTVIAFRPARPKTRLPP